MIKLIAVNYSDAYALVEIDRIKYAIRPPFRGKGQPISEEDIEKAIAFHGFLPEQKDFNDWSELIKYLSSKAIENRKVLEQESPDSEKIKSLIKKAPLEQVEKFLARIEDELIPNSETKAAGNLLINLLKNPLVRREETLLDKCTVLLEECNRIEEERENWLERAVNPQPTIKRFPRAARVFGPDYVQGLTNCVREQGQVLCVGSSV